MDRNNKFMSKWVKFPPVQNMVHNFIGLLIKKLVSSTNNNGSNKFDKIRLKRLVAAGAGTLP